MRKWWRLPSRVALLLGLGALSVSGARADLPEASQDRGAAAGDVLIRSEGGKIFLSEGGEETELRLGATPQRDRLLRLLEEHGPAGVKLDRDPRLIMSGGGGAGFSLRDVIKSVTGEPRPAPQNPPQSNTPPNSPEQGSAPRDRNHPVSDKKE